MISPRLAAVSFALAAALPAFAASYDGEAPFEKAAETSTVKLGPSDAAPPAEKEVRCFYFPRLMVKELDEREIGDTQISYMIGGPGQQIPECTDKPIAGERKLHTEESYFLGVAATRRPAVSRAATRFPV